MYTYKLVGTFIEKDPWWAKPFETNLQEAQTAAKSKAIMKSNFSIEICGEWNPATLSLLRETITVSPETNIWVHRKEIRNDENPKPIQSSEIEIWN